MLEFKQATIVAGKEYTETADIITPCGTVVGQLCIIGGCDGYPDVSLGFYEGADGIAHGDIYTWWEGLDSFREAYEIAEAAEVAVLSGTMFYPAGPGEGVLKPYRNYIGGRP